ncbi:hypothetical protein N8508_00780 [bacterium]|nr:hypothetical protein [bacterium]
MFIKLSKEDVHSAQLLGADTVKICEMQGFKPRLENDKQSREQANVCGYMAEFAVCRLFNLPEPKFNILSDGGIDLWWNGISIDVKWTGKECGPLIFDDMDKFRAQIAILVGSTSDHDVMRINGWVDKIKFRELAEPHNFGWGERLKLEPHNLYPIERLWRYMMVKTLSPEDWKER